MEGNSVVFAFFLIFFGASVLATLALYTRQSIILAYIALGALVGPWGYGLINNTEVINEISSVGIMFLLFLLGLNLQPKRLLGMLKRATLVTIVSAITFAFIGGLLARFFGFSWQDSIILGVAMIFSSTIIGLKLLPTTALHHQHIGEVVVSILLLQDMIAIIVLLILDIMGSSGGSSGADAWTVIKIFAALPVVIFVGYFAEKYVLFALLKKFNRFKEYIFLLAIGWCLGLAELGYVFGVSHEIGAFVAGVALAASPISQYIAESLKPLRDFFLIVFFFSVGASFNYHLLPSILIPALFIAGLMLILKPVIYCVLLKTIEEKTETAMEMGVRLGQVSEFSLLVAFMAFNAHLLGQSAYILIQAITILTFVASSYFIVMKYPTPIATSEQLRRD